MVSNPEYITDEGPSLSMTQTTVKKRSAKKSLCLLTNIFDITNRTAFHRVVDAESKLRAIKSVYGMFKNKIKRK